MNKPKPSSVLQDLHKLGGCYLCPKDSDGKRLGPLVGYAGRDAQGRQLVGDVYANFAVAEEHPTQILHWAWRLRPRIERYFNLIDAFLGAPRGGESFADKLAQICNKRYLYPEKQVVELATGSSREKTELMFKRHQIKPGMRVALVEDVMNNFTTTGNMIDLVAAAGGTVTVILGILNRSPHIEDAFWHRGQDFPVIAVHREALPEYEQDDPKVAADIAAGNVCWKAKDSWAELMAAMEQTT